MKYLVLGSSGQIGSFLMQYITSRGHQAIPFDYINDPGQDLRVLHNHLLIKNIQEADFVFFLAFDVGGSRYLKMYQNTFDFISNNVRLMDFTFEILEKTKKPFLFASSQMSNMNYSYYGQLKALGEIYTKTLNGLIVKFWNVYGLEHNFEKSHVITDFILKAQKNKKIEMITNGEEQRQFLFAEDCCECLVYLAEHFLDIPREKQLHVTSFTWNSIEEIAEIVASLYPGTTIIKPAHAVDEIQKDKRNEPDPYILNFWRPRTTIREGIEIVNKLYQTYQA